MSATWTRKRCLTSATGDVGGSPPKIFPQLQTDLPREGPRCVTAYLFHIARSSQEIEPPKPRALGSVSPSGGLSLARCQRDLPDFFGPVITLETGQVPLCPGSEFLIEVNSADVLAGCLESRVCW